MPTPPDTEAELLNRAEAIAGKSLLELSAQHHVPIPTDLTTSKGWVGELLEIVLGASAGTKPEPDFTRIGVELKTLPLKSNGSPKESTYLCTAQLTYTNGIRWEDSLVKKKLSRVLWIPIEADPEIQLAERKIGSPLLWSASVAQEKILKQDWEEIMELIVLGQLEQISSSLGRYLQLRPKAANARSLCHANNDDGEKILTLPRGFYLRAKFTRTILEAHYLS